MKRMLSRRMTALNKMYPAPRQWVKETPRDKHDFNDRYIAAVTKRIKALRYNSLYPKKKAQHYRPGVFWVSAETPYFPAHRLKTKRAKENEQFRNDLWSMCI